MSETALLVPRPGALSVTNSIDSIIAHGRRANLDYAPVDFGFFETYRIHPLAGRTFAADHPADDGANHTADAPPIMINEAAAHALGFSSAQAAIGQLVNWHFRAGASLKLAGSGLIPPYRPSQIIGVVPDFTFGSVRSAVQPTFFYVGQKVDLLTSVALNVRLDPARIAQTLPRVERVWKDVSHGQPLQEVFASQFMLRLYIDTIIEGSLHRGLRADRGLGRVPGAQSSRYRPTPRRAPGTARKSACARRWARAQATS